MRIRIVFYYGTNQSNTFLIFQLLPSGQILQFVIQMIEYRKTSPECFDDLLQIYNHNCQSILHHYLNSDKQHDTSNLDILDHLFMEYIHMQNMKKSLIEAQEPLTSLIKTSKKHKYSGMKALSNKMKRLSIEQTQDILNASDDEDNEDSMRVNDDKEYEKELNKDLKTLIEESYQKSCKKNQQSSRQEKDCQIEGLGNDLEVLSEYEMTDYSSNQSSNEGSYCQHYQEDSVVKPLFGGLFQVHKLHSKSSDSSNYSQKTVNGPIIFKTKQFLKSPKKSHKKRLFIKNKRIPRWAEDMQIIANISKESRNLNPNKIYGKCIAQNLNTNCLFGDSSQVERTSSAKWAKNYIFEH